MRSTCSPSRELLFLLPLAACLGCGEAPPLETHPIRGQILVDGQPAENAFVVLIPKQVPEEVKTLAPRGKTDAQGYFDLSSFRSRDGAPQGEYYVGVQWRKIPGNFDRTLLDTDAVYELPDALKGEFADPVTSGLTVTIEDETDELRPIDVVTSK